MIQTNTNTGDGIWSISRKELDCVSSLRCAIDTTYNEWAVSWTRHKHVQYGVSYT
jgi:hypothetical protein